MVRDVSSVGSYMGQMNSRPIQQQRGKIFENLDSNGDGGIDKTEFNVIAEKISERTGTTVNVDDVYSLYDKDSDSALNKDELQSFVSDNPPLQPINVGHGLGRLFITTDGNGDGGVDKTEFNALAERISERTGTTVNVDDVYSLYDKDGDSALSRVELKNFVRDNPPPPPIEPQHAMSAYGKSMGKGQIAANKQTGSVEITA